ncbi:arsenic resistance protein [uncultured Stenotrophomonas sp.]|uniref:arsenic resistance protein n=1 Tax=uncultured Stenotrophomonas sp. TaxID=165438 RepID=UPI0025F90890|nr:arsenic resistance protein [uncultured Stenotrophomonas sp.]
MKLHHLREQMERHQTAIYFAAMAMGFLLALKVPGTGRLEVLITPALGAMLFVTFLQVPLSSIAASLRNLRFVAALLVTNFIAIPLLVALMVPMFPEQPLIAIAMLFVLLCPCIDYVVTFSHLGKSDAPLLLATTPILLIVQMILLPLYLKIFLGQAAADLVRPGPFLHAFGFLIVIPILLAATLQGLGRRSVCMEEVERIAGALPVPATAAVLLIVIAAVTPQLEAALQAVAAALPVYLIYAAIAPLVGLAVARSFNIPAAAQRAIAFSAATRNSLVVLPLALVVPGALPIIPAVIVTQTLVELVATLVYIPLIPRLAKAP